MAILRDRALVIIKVRILVTHSYVCVCVCVCVCVSEYSVVSDSLQPHGLKPVSLLCPWDFPSKNAGVGCHALLQGIFPAQGVNLHLLHWQAAASPRSHLGSPYIVL